MRYVPMNLRLEGAARCGGPVDLQLCGRWDVHGFVKAVANKDFTEEEFLSFFTRHMVMTGYHLDHLSRARGEMVKVLALRQCEGVSLTSHMPVFVILL